MIEEKDLRITLFKGVCAYCRQKRVVLRGERWQAGNDSLSPWYSQYICLDCGERFTLIERE
ncbi:hypothetical protein [Pelotomaculum propionicicum]|uniref:hypothetical protein n=1 Tax=Pelotomaculum propionicicum TaxID=258475 RepID=UPI003BA07CAA